MHNRSLKKTGVCIIVIFTVITIIALPCFADTVIQVQNSITSTNNFLNDTFKIILNSTTGDPVLVSSFTDGSVWDYTTEQLYFIHIRLLNSDPNGNYVNLHTPNLSFIATCPALAPGVTGVTYDYSTAVDFTMGDITSIEFRPSDGRCTLTYNNRNIYVAPNTTINMFICLKRVTQIHSTNSAFTFFPSRVDAPVSSLSLGQTYSPDLTTTGVSSDNSYILRELFLNSEDIITHLSTIISNNASYAYEEQRWLIDIARNIDYIDDSLDQILANYGANSSYATTVTSSANTVTSDVDYVHEQESSYYVANEDALSDAGIANFDFDNSTKLGYQSVNEEFNRLWVALGRWNFIYVFTLLLSLVAYILRHRPWTTLGTHHDN